VTEIRELCDQMIATPPPMRDSASVLAAARRSLARRRAGVAGVGALAVAAATATVLTLPSVLAGAAPIQAPPVVAASGPVSVSAGPPAPTVLPPARAAFTHSEQMRQLLLAQIPSGYVVSQYPVAYDTGFDPTAVLPNQKYPAPTGGAMDVAFAGEFLAAGGGQGLLSASILATADAPPAAPCQGNPAGTVCHIVTVDGVNIEVSTWHDQSGRHIGAVRRLQGGVLMVIASQGLGTGDTTRPKDAPSGQDSRIKPPLATLPFTEQQLAALAADPAMLQFP